jgi:hypothetical protein
MMVHSRLFSFLGVFTLTSIAATSMSFAAVPNCWKNGIAPNFITLIFDNAKQSAIASDALKQYGELLTYQLQGNSSIVITPNSQKGQQELETQINRVLRGIKRDIHEHGKVEFKCNPEVTQTEKTSKRPAAAKSLLGVKSDRKISKASLSEKDAPSERRRGAILQIQPTSRKEAKKALKQLRIEWTTDFLVDDQLMVPVTGTQSDIQELKEKNYPWLLHTAFDGGLKALSSEDKTIKTYSVTVKIALSTDIAALAQEYDMSLDGSALLQHAKDGTAIFATAFKGTQANFERLQARNPAWFLEGKEVSGRGFELPSK